MCVSTHPSDVAALLVQFAAGVDERARDGGQSLLVLALRATHLVQRRAVILRREKCVCVCVCVCVMREETECVCLWCGVCVCVCVCVCVYL